MLPAARRATLPVLARAAPPGHQALLTECGAQMKDHHGHPDAALLLPIAAIVPAIISTSLLCHSVQHSVAPALTPTRNTLEQTSTRRKLCTLL